MPTPVGPLEHMVHSPQLLLTDTDLQHACYMLCSFMQQHKGQMPRQDIP